jgi:hypothetical protein
MVVELVVLVSDSLYAAEDCEEALLEFVGVPLEFLSRLKTHRLNVLAGPPRAHGADVVRTEARLDRADVIAVARHDQRAAALSAREAGPRRHRGVNDGLHVVRLRRRRRRRRVAAVVGVRVGSVDDGRVCLLVGHSRRLDMRGVRGREGLDEGLGGSSKVL